MRRYLRWTLITGSRRQIANLIPAEIPVCWKLRASLVVVPSSCPNSWAENMQVSDYLWSAYIPLSMDCDRWVV